MNVEFFRWRDQLVQWAQDTYGHLLGQPFVQKVSMRFDTSESTILFDTTKDGSLSASIISNVWHPFRHDPKITLKGFVKTYVNNHYQVHIREMPSPFSEEPMIWLSIRHRLNIPLNDWRDMQRIKNELCGTTCEAISIYPMDERLVDASNQFHLWCFPPGVRLPIGYQQRDVFHTQEAAEKEFKGVKQRDFAEHHFADGCPEVGPAWDDIKK